MSAEKDFENWTLEELLQAKKKMKQKQMIAAVVIGFSFGVMLYGIAKNGFGLIYVLIPLLLIYVIYKNEQHLKKERRQIEAEIKSRGELL